MSDWKNNQYDYGPKPDPLAGAESVKYVGLAVLIVVGVVASIGLFVFGLLAWL